MLKHKKGLIVLLIASALCLAGAISAMFSKGECKHVYDERTNICKSAERTDRIQSRIILMMTTAGRIFIKAVT